MTTFRFDLNPEYSKRLEADASAKRMNVQEYIRYKLFDKVSIFSVEEVVRRIQSSGDFENTEFTVPDVYTKKEWSTISRGSAGVLGRNFFNHISEHPELGIRFIPDHTIKRRAAYFYKKINY